MSLTTGLTLTSSCCRCGNSELRTLARTPVTLDLELPPPLPNNLLGYIYLMLEDTINFGGGDLPKLTLNNLPQPVEHGLLIGVHELEGIDIRETADP
eukprot:COSAG01_NODE_1229_length_11124_cov_14.205896_3_plen_97_part_00